MYNIVTSTQMSCNHLFCIFDFSIFETIIIVASHQPLKHTEELAVFKSLKVAEHSFQEPMPNSP